MESHIIESLKNREQLLEKEVDYLKSKAAEMYLNYIKLGGASKNIDYIQAYQTYITRNDELTKVREFLK